MSTTPKVSVIIPAYRTAHYLPDCIKSLRRQTVSEWEAIIIDDGSDDSTPTVCDRLAAEDSRISVMHTENRGVAAARNRGVSMAKGELLTFLDSDDMIEPEYLEQCVAMIEKYDTDIAATGSRDVDADAGIADCRDPKFRRRKTKVMPGAEAIKRVLYQKGPDNSLWSKTFRRRLWDDVRVREGIIYEDLEVMPRLLLKSRRVAYNPTPMYLYRNNPASITKVFSERRLIVLDITDEIVDIMRRNCPSAVKAARSRRLSAHFNILGLADANGGAGEKVARRCLTAIKQERAGALTDPNVRLRNKLMAAVSLLLGLSATRKILKKIYTK